MNKKIIKNNIVTNKVTENQIVKKEQESRIHFVATQPIKTVLDSLETTLIGLDTENVSKHRHKYGTNKITKEKNLGQYNVMPHGHTVSPEKAVEVEEHAVEPF